MSIQLIDDSDSLGQLATNQGWRDLQKWVEDNCDGLDALQEFADTAECDDIPALANDVKEAMTRKPQQDIASTLKNLAKLLESAEGGVTAS